MGYSKVLSDACINISVPKETKVFLFNPWHFSCVLLASREEMQ